MLGITGWVFPEAFGTLPAAAYHNTNPIQAMTEVGFLPMAQIFLACMVFEGIAYNKKAKKNYANPGDYGWDAFGLTKSGGANNHYRRAEIKNGRLGSFLLLPPSSFSLSYPVFPCQCVMPSNILTLPLFSFSAMCIFFFLLLLLPFRWSCG